MFFKENDEESKCRKTEHQKMVKLFSQNFLTLHNLTFCFPNVKNINAKNEKKYIENNQKLIQTRQN